MAAAIDQKPRSLFDLPPDFFDAARLLASPATPYSSVTDAAAQSGAGDGESEEAERGAAAATVASAVAPRWTCNTCGAEFESLHDQRAHFKSDLHRLNVKLSMVGKTAIKEEDYDELGSDSMKDFDLSSISGSEDEFENIPKNDMSGIAREGTTKQKLYLQLQSGETVSVWRCLLLGESEDIWLQDKKTNDMENVGSMPCVEEDKLIDRLRYLIREPRDKAHLRVILLASGGHFAGCVFDGNTIIAHKTFHRYVVRAKSGKKQSAKDGTGKAGHSAGSSLRRYNEAALKKEIQELLVNWETYINCSSCILMYAPSKTRQLLYDGESPLLNLQNSLVRHVPMTVRRPTLKEAKRIYNQLTQMVYEVSQQTTPEGASSLSSGDIITNQQVEEAHSDSVEKKEDEAQSGEKLDIDKPSSGSALDIKCLSSEMENMVKSIGLSPNGNETTPLHEAAKSGNAQRTLELLEQGLNPCLKDERGRPPYVLATDKEVRNTFRRFMALNLDMWDWNAASVPSPLPKEMEEAQAAKQAEKDAKRKAKAKELKKLRKEKEKAQAKAAQTHSASSTAVPQPQVAVRASALKQQPQSSGVILSKEEEQRRALAEAREKRAAAAERRIAALNAQASTTAAPSSSAADVTCSCCNASLAGKVPFHRYHYKYCSTSCMHVHREMLEDG